MERQPIKTIPIHEHLRPRLCDTYENDSIFDKFEVVFSGDAKNVMTGSYNNNFMIYPSDPDKEVEVVLQADKSAFKAKKVGIPTPINSSTSPTANGGKKGGSRAGSPAAGGQGQRMRKETDADQIDFNKKILHMSWHPFEDSIAIAATNNVRYPLAARSSSCRLLTRILALCIFCPVNELARSPWVCVEKKTGGPGNQRKDLILAKGSFGEQEQTSRANMCVRQGVWRDIRWFSNPLVMAFGANRSCL